MGRRSQGMPVCSRGAREPSGASAPVAKGVLCCQSSSMHLFFFTWASRLAFEPLPAEPFCAVKFGKT